VVARHAGVSADPERVAIEPGWGGVLGHGQEGTGGARPSRLTDQCHTGYSFGMDTITGYVPSPMQTFTVIALNALGRSPRWVVDAGPLDVAAFEDCANDSEHGPATVYGLPGCVDGFCPGCAAIGVELTHADPHWAGGTLSLDVFDEPAVSATGATR